MRAVVSDAAASAASTTLLFSIFAGVALLLGIVGIYGVLSFLVTTKDERDGNPHGTRRAA